MLCSGPSRKVSGPCVLGNCVQLSCIRTWKLPSKQSHPHLHHKAHIIIMKSSSDEGVASNGSEDTKSAEYTQEMQAKMGTSLTYRHEAGLDYNRVLPDLIVGSCLQTPADVDRLAEQEGVKVVYCLQEDCDMEYFNLDVSKIQERCEERGDIKHVRFPIRDFDPYDLRMKLPKAITRLAKEHDPSKGTVYIHCTAGMGRAPATAVAYMAWIRGIPVDTAYEMMTTVRRCSPKIQAIRSATADLLLGTGPVAASIAVHRPGTATSIQVAGLDVGWHQKLDLKRDPTTHRFLLHRDLLPGSYPYKLVVDGNWTYSADHPTIKDGENINNVLDVSAALDAVSSGKFLRYISQGTVLTAEELQELSAMLCPWATHEAPVQTTNSA
ncbi:hypothetical protein CEUSTIGMA_g3176.t1 [Chlamydomonas eustigma]|uniref:Tyrosine specific protein phosphatases domain-containing protein n=1 Tax=Chlamydomonas eustigma TaxID=1157962 RepID=A0A250WY15_9CHLO|nr:hypothetical protein CEUSTIGMA_g3176.t1 [Chlamydomonas eustigma]|eukprot:GAX75733.1 hypothetical protein CEUSTIGMA_g3176.t1 [Chlamydomonas eustigma]